MINQRRKRKGFLCNKMKEVEMKKTAWNDNWILKKQDGTNRKVTLPHDAMIEEVRSPEAPSGSAGAYFPGGIYTYEKVFSGK